MHFERQEEKCSFCNELTHQALISVHSLRIYSFQILCSKQPLSFQWLETNDTEIASLVRKYDPVYGVNKRNRNDVTLIRGGHQGGLLTYLGRVKIESEVALGKIMCKFGSLTARIYVARHEKEHNYGGPFDILVYNPGTLYLSHRDR